MTQILATSLLTRCFGSLTAVDSLSLSVERGEVFGLLGRNGAGKTTLLKMLTTLLRPTSGSATVAGYDIVRQGADVRRVIGYVPQILSTDGELTGYEFIVRRGHHRHGNRVSAQAHAYDVAPAGPDVAALSHQQPLAVRRRLRVVMQRSCRRCRELGGSAPGG